MEKYRSGRRWHICDPINPDALIFKVWPELARSIMEVDKKYLGKCWLMTDGQVNRWAKPTHNLELFRIAFWGRIYECNRHNQMVKQWMVCEGLISTEHFREILKRDSLLVFMVRPVPRMEAAMEDLFWKGLRKMHDFLDHPVDWDRVVGSARHDYLRLVLTMMEECWRKMSPPSYKYMKISRQRRKQFLESLEEDIRMEQKSKKLVKTKKTVNLSEVEALGEDDGFNPNNVDLGELDDIFMDDDGGYLVGPDQGDADNEVAEEGFEERSQEDEEVNQG